MIPRGHRRQPPPESIDASDVGCIREIAGLVYHAWMDATRRADAATDGVAERSARREAIEWARVLRSYLRLAMDVDSSDRDIHISVHGLESDVPSRPEIV